MKPEGSGVRRCLGGDGLRVGGVAARSGGGRGAVACGFQAGGCGWALNECVGLLWLLVLMGVFAPAAMAEERVHLDCTPRTFRVVPGEPMRLELTVHADSAEPIRLHVPGDPRLKLRAVEKLPVQRTREGAIAHKRVVVWQGLEPGTITMKNLSVETKGQKRLFPEVTITVVDPGS